MKNDILHLKQCIDMPQDGHPIKKKSYPNIKQRKHDI